MAATPLLLPGESPGQRSLAGYSPCGRKRVSTAERLNNWVPWVGSRALSPRAVGGLNTQPVWGEQSQAPRWAEAQEQWLQSGGVSMTPLKCRASGRPSQGHTAQLGQSPDRAVAPGPANLDAAFSTPGGIPRPRLRTGARTVSTRRKGSCWDQRAGRLIDPARAWFRPSSPLWTVPLRELPTSGHLHSPTCKPGPVRNLPQGLLGGFMGLESVNTPQGAEPLF